MPYFRCKHGGVDYNIDEFHGSCGIAVVHGCEFYSSSRSMSIPEEQRFKLYKSFYNFLKNNSDISGSHYSMNRRAILLLSDNVNKPADNAGKISEMCEYLDMLEGAAVTNVKSGNKIKVWEMYRSPRALKAAAGGYR